MKFIARFLHPGYGSFSYLTCGCEGPEGFIIFRTPGGALRAECLKCGGVTYLTEDAPSHANN